MLPEDFVSRIVNIDGQDYIIVSGDIGGGWSYGVISNGVAERAAPLYLIKTD